jgi:hypothetical protein
MNMKFYSSLLALGTFASAVLLGITPVSADTGNGSNPTNNASTSTLFSPVFPTQASAPVNAAFRSIIQVNPTAFTSLSSPAALTPPGAPSVAGTAANLSLAIAALTPGGITRPQLSNAINTYNIHAENVVNTIGGANAKAFFGNLTIKADLEKLAAAAK